METGSTDKELARLNGLAKLKSLSLAVADIGDAGLAKLKSLSGLESLNVRKTRVTDAGVEESYRKHCRTARFSH